MGMRSQIYVRYNNGNKKGLIAKYYSCNYGEEMVSRAKWGIEHILRKLLYKWYYTDKSNVKRLSKIFDANFDTCDVAVSCDILQEFEELFQGENFREHVFQKQDNNNGKLFVDICDDSVRYAFMDSEANSDNIMDGEAYMRWDCGNGENWRKRESLSEDEIRTCEENIKFISENATLMSKEEVEEFINYDYMADIPQIWIIGICNSEGNGVNLLRFIGTDAEAKEELLHHVMDDKQNDMDTYDSGTESLDEIEKVDHSFYAYGNYRDYHIEYTAKKLYNLE